MNPKPRDVITGFIVVLILIIGIVWIYKSKNNNNKPLISPTPQTSITNKIKDTFKNFNIPDDVAKNELKDVSGGNGIGIATETEVLANLPDLSNNEFYQVWFDDNGTLKSLGKMRIAKGGYLYEGNLKEKKIVVSREKIFDNKLEVKILE